MGVTLARTNPAELLPSTLDLLVLRTLVCEANHGYGIERASDHWKALNVEHPAG
jgi:hypothetical protein